MDRYTNAEWLDAQYGDPEHLKTRQREIFPEVRVHVFENALVFPGAEPAMSYWRSMHDDPELEAAMASGSFRVALVAGCFVAEV